MNRHSAIVRSRVAACSLLPQEEVRRTGSVEARAELHQRLALPVACVLLALVGIPLGAVSRKTGRGAAFVVTIFLAFLYYMSLVSLIGMSQSGRLSPELAARGPNVLFGLIGLALYSSPSSSAGHDLLRSYPTYSGFWRNSAGQIWTT